MASAQSREHTTTLFDHSTFPGSSVLRSPKVIKMDYLFLSRRELQGK